MFKKMKNVGNIESEVWVDAQLHRSGDSGSGAQLVDGSLGMAYGVTSTTLLLAVGVSPALASASVHLAEVGTCAASGISHWRFGNVDWSKIGWMAVPGGIGAFLGAIAVTWVATVAEELVAPVIAIFLFALGVYVLARFSFRRRENPVVERPFLKVFWLLWGW